MSRWKGLPASLDHRVRQLVVQLRRLKDHSGLSLAALAAKTSYSKSSWERYLNGKKLPPRDAVEALARVCGVDATRLLVLHEVAAQAWESGREGEPATVGAEAGPDAIAGGTAVAKDVEDAEGAKGAKGARGGPLASRGGPAVPAVLAVLAVLVVAGAVLLVVRPWQHAHDTDARPGTDTTVVGRSVSAAPTFSRRPGETFTCQVRRTAGALSAGHSRTATAILGNGVSGWETVEAQCLLRHHGFDPGPVDGIVGERTMRAAKRLQSRAGLPPDGIVGPDTWKVLRR
ncbi:helix-turn-helix domain-containing protein [Streptomyces sp. NBRC 110611]|uniref:helix-turn-helix domain-containing protein n=1 Tax=Streptomyces sp. NBRC 110611 TaxID=1621259 RepID=UPI000830A06D|nr:helix-turn-helix domain-containing protein [Streptomyces sp. NBRC 110611]